MLLLFVLLSVVVLLFVFVKLYEYKKVGEYRDVTTGKPIKHVRGILRSLLDLKSSRYAWLRDYDMSKSTDFEPFLSFIGPFPLFVTADAQDAKKVLLQVNSFPKMTMKSDYVERTLGKPFALANGHEWSNQREIVNPAFYNIERFSSIFDLKTKICLDRFNSLVVKKTGVAVIDVARFCTNLTLDVLGSSVFNHEFRALEGEDTEFYEAYEYVITNLNNKSSILLGKAYTSLPLESNIKFNRSLKMFDDLIHDLIDQARKKPEKEEMSLLDLMIKGETSEGFKMDDKTLRDNVTVFFIAGHDTTSSALAFCLYMLGKHRHVQDKLREEILAVVGTDINTEITSDHLAQLEYLTCVISETMRLFPPVPVIPFRRVTKSGEVLGNIKLKKGSMLVVATYSLHRNPKYWDNPTEFDPLRFSSERRKGRNTFAYMPFGAGPRVCIGNNFSLLEQKIFLIRLMQRFAVELTDPHFVLQPHGSDVLQSISKDFQLLLTPLQ